MNGASTGTFPNAIAIANVIRENHDRWWSVMSTCAIRPSWHAGMTCEKSGCGTRHNPPEVTA